MLVLSRKSNESIVIGDQIVIEILEISNNKIRIGIAAPSDVRVVRGELTPKAPVPGRGASVTDQNHGGPNRAVASKSNGKTPPAQHGRLRNSGNNCPVNNSVKEQPLDQPLERGLARPLDRLRRSVVGGSGGGSANPNVRTVADEARHRLRQLRQQIHQEVPNLDLIDSEPVGQGVAEPSSPYQVRPLRQASQRVSQSASQKSQQDLMSCSSDERTARQEVYWQVEALNQYRGEWVAEENCWYEMSTATV